MESKKMYVEEKIDKVLSFLEILKTDVEEIKNGTGEMILNFPQATEYLGIAGKTLRKKMQSGEIAYSKPGGKVYFTKEELIRYQLSNPVKTTHDVRRSAEIYEMRRKAK